MQDFFQEAQLLTAFNASEVLFRSEQRSGRPTHDHSRSIPAFNLVGSVGGLRKTVLNEVGIAEDAAEPGRKIGFFLAQAARSRQPAWAFLSSGNWSSTLRSL